MSKPALRDAHVAGKRLHEALQSDGYALQETQIMTSTGLFAHGRCIKRGDVVLVEQDGEINVGLVCFHVSVDGDLWSGVSMWRVMERNRVYLRCMVKDPTELVRSDLLLEACVHTRLTGTPNESIRVLLPSRWRLAT